jgi:hypothetical protein
MMEKVPAAAAGTFVFLPARSFEALSKQLKLNDELYISW